MKRAPFFMASLVGFFAMVFVGHQVRVSVEGDLPPVEGWCCMADGATCRRMPSVESCRYADGIAFDTTRGVCASVCNSR